MTAPGIAETRASILSAVVAQAGAHGGLLFEPQSGAAKIASLTRSTHESAGGDWDAGLSTRSLFARWLRVNGITLPLPEPTGLWGSLPAPCREWLVHRSVQACTPLVHDMKLVGWVFVLGGHQWSMADPRIDRIGISTPAWAGALSAAQVEHAAAARSALVSRSNRLSLAGHLAASGAHEARNSLAAVRSMVQLVLSKDAEAAEHDRLLATVLTEVDRVNTALSRTLALGLTRDSTWRSVDVSQLVTDAATFCRAYAHRRSQVLTVHSTSAASVRGDRHELRQVLVNTLLNACQASEDGASIVVEHNTSDAGYVSVVVRDTGSGMTSDVIARAFEPFYSTKPDGGGLGLAISKDIVQQHGGTIMLQSVVANGTTVTICLPLEGARDQHSGS